MYHYVLHALHRPYVLICRLGGTVARRFSNVSFASVAIVAYVCTDESFSSTSILIGMWRLTDGSLSIMSAKVMRLDGDNSRK